MKKVSVVAIARISLVLILIATMLLLGSCGTKRRVVTSESRVVDSVVVKTEIIKAPLLTDAITLKEICKDSVATEFKRVFVRDTDTITIEVKDNNLLIDLKQQERIISQLEQKLEHYENLLKESERIRNSKGNFWLHLRYWAGILLVIFLMTAFPGIGRFIRRLVN